MSDTVVLCISPDLPFANKRFCDAEGIADVIPLSTFRAPDFGESYGTTLTTTQRRGLLARAVVIINPEGTVTYTELVPELTHEPDYQQALKAIAR